MSRLMVRRLLVLLAIPTLIVPFMSSNAVAGGSWLEIRGVEGAGAPSEGPWGGWAAPGAVVTMRAAFSSGSQAGVSAGPWDAYLTGPGNELIYLAPVEIGPATGNYGSHVASVTFAVPSIASGGYHVNVCADPRCEIGGVGDLAGGFFTVAATGAEARALNELSWVKADLQRSRQVQERLREQVAALELEVDQATGARKIAERTAAQEAATADELTAERDDLAIELASARSGEGTWRLVAIASMATLATTIGFLVWRRRRSPRVVVPDTPEELVEAMPPADRGSV
jgi:hypothetical protein